MAIEWPASLTPREMTWGIVYNNRAFTSSLSNAQQLVGYPGAYWQCQLSFPALFGADERELTSMLGRLQGMFGTVKIPAFTRTRADNIGSPKVAQASTQATFMQLNGVTASAKVFSRGDYITVADEMFEVVDDATSNASGLVTLNLNKRIRRAISSSTAVEYRNPYAVMRRADDTHQISIQPIVANANLAFREAF